MYNSLVVDTTYGPVRGRIDSQGIAAFKGIRYGADTGRYRFQPPRPPQPWTEVINAFEYGPTCPQDHPDTSIDRATNPFLIDIGLTDNLPESEDCLFINVWSSAEAISQGAGRPVLVWVHSGAYSDNSGSSPSIDGAHLARTEDLVTVSFNHRLGVLGYTQVCDPRSDPESPYATSGNTGHLDIIAALEWVHRNIERFGGDPQCVTIAGQSGGAMKISGLMAMPMAQDLFQQAITQSGATNRVLTLDEAAQTRSKLLTELGLSQDAGGDELAAVPLLDLMRAYRNLTQSNSELGTVYFSPVVDGLTMPSQPFSPQATALSGDKPLMIGDMNTEASLFLQHMAKQLRSEGYEGIKQRLIRLLGKERSEKLLSNVIATYGQDDPYWVAVQAISAGLFTGPAHVAAQRRKAGADAPTFRYRNLLTTPVKPDVLGSPHELDVALTFGNIDCAVGINGGTHQARAVCALLGQAWAAFARSGNPSCDLTGLWPAYDDVGSVMLISDTPRLGQLPDQALLEEMHDLADANISWLNFLS